MAAKRQTTRRDFLAGRSALQAIADLPALDEAQAKLREAESMRNSENAADSTRATTENDARSCLLQVSRTAMACEFRVLLAATEQLHGTEAALESLDLVECLEDQLTVFREDSELSRINRTAATGPVAAESRLFDLLQLAVGLYRATDGAFDITAGPLWKTWGFHHRAGRFPGQAEIDKALVSVGSQWLTLDPGAATVSFERPGLELNLGSIGKGYALDRCDELLGARGIEDFAIHGGMSSILARGNRPGSESGKGWTIVLRHPLRHDQKLLQVQLHNRALATSGSANQFFHFEGKRYAHVIDPRTGFPADGLLSATVLAPTAAEADALATAFFVMGADQTIAFCTARQDLAVILVCPGVRSGAVTLRTCGLAAAEWKRLS